jgi:hypothetical protein
MSTFRVKHEELKNCCSVGIAFDLSTQHLHRTMIRFPIDFSSKTAKIIVKELNQFLTVCKGQHNWRNDSWKKENHWLSQKNESNCDDASNVLPLEASVYFLSFLYRYSTMLTL